MEKMLGETTSQTPIEEIEAVGRRFNVNRETAGTETREPVAFRRRVRA
jgi:hypothetical protein